MLSKLLKMLENQLSQIYRYILTMQQDTSKKCYKLPKKNTIYLLWFQAFNECKIFRNCNGEYCCSQIKKPFLKSKIKMFRFFILSKSLNKNTKLRDSIQLILKKKNLSIWVSYSAWSLYHFMHQASPRRST